MSAFVSSTMTTLIPFFNWDRCITFGFALLCPAGIILQFTGGNRATIVNGPSQDDSRHLLSPGARFNTVSPFLKLEMAFDSSASLCLLSFDLSASFTIDDCAAVCLSTSAMNCGTLTVEHVSPVHNCFNVCKIKVVGFANVNSKGV